MTEWNQPLDGANVIAAKIMGKVRKDLLDLRQPNWEPTPMPIRYYPTDDEVLHPEPYAGAFPTILGDRLITPNHLDDEVTFYDYALRGGAG